MNTLRSSARGALVWMAPFALLVLLLAWQTDWGRAFARTPPAESAAAPAPLAVALLPEYQPAAGQEPENNVQLDVSALAYPEAPRVTAASK